MNSIIQDLIKQLEEVQSSRIWIGTSFERMLQHIDDQNAFERPLEGMHSVAEIVSHLLLWRQEAVLKIETGEGSKTDQCEENWFNNDHLRPKGWNRLRDEYESTTARLIELLKEKDDSFLQEEYYDTDFKGRYPYRFVLQGMLHHDLYHLGQLGFVVKYLKKKGLIAS